MLVSTALSLQCCDILFVRRGGAKDVNADERIAVGHEIMSAPVEELARLIYPALYALHDPSGPWGTEDPATGKASCCCATFWMLC